MKVWCLLIVAVLCSCSAAQPQSQAPQNGLKSGVTTSKSNEYIITLGKDIRIEDLKTQLADHGLIIVKDIGRKRYVVRFNQDPGLGELKKQACFKSSKCSIQPNYKYKHF